LDWKVDGVGDKVDGLGSKADAPAEQIANLAETLGEIDRRVSKNDDLESAIEYRKERSP